MKFASYLTSSGIPLVRISLDALESDRGQIARNRRIEPPGIRRIFRQLVVQLHAAITTKWQFASLHARRLCLRIVNSIDLGTRWAVFEADGERVERRVRVQIEAYLAALASIGVLASERFSVDCEVSHRELTILVAFQPPGCVDPVTFTLHQAATGCRVTATAFAPVMENCA